MPVCCEKPQLRFDWHYGHAVDDVNDLVVRISLITCDACGSAFRLANDGEILTVDGDRTGFTFHVVRIAVH